MAETWYAEIDGKTAGPFGREQFRTMADGGRVTTTTRVRAGDGPWTRAGDAGGPLEASAVREEPPKSGSQYAIEIDPSLNDTTEFRMLAETAKVETVKPYTETARPLPRRVPASESGSAAAGGRGWHVAAVLVAIVVVVIAVAVWMASAG